MPILMQVTYYVASVISILLYILSIQLKDKSRILFVQIIASGFYIICYILLNAFSGVYFEIFDQIKNSIAIWYEKHNKKMPIYLFVIFIIVLVIISFINFNGSLYLLVPLFINVLCLISVFFKNPQAIRIVIFICGFLWGIYNFYVGAYVIIFGNVLEVFSSGISIIRYKNIIK